MLSGSGAPAGSLGNFYINTANHTLYGPKDRHRRLGLTNPTCSVAGDAGFGGTVTAKAETNIAVQTSLSLMSGGTVQLSCGGPPTDLSPTATRGSP